MTLITTAFLAISPLILSAAAAPVIVGDLELEYCHLSGYSQEVLCGVHTVYEDRRQQQGRTIDIQFGIIPAVAIDKEDDPLVFFAGGPGQGSTEVAGFADVAFEDIAENRDIVLIDQRGMGTSHPLDCETSDDISLLLLSEEERARIAREELQTCLGQLDADVTKYTQDLANEDIHEILLALGYEQVNLYGGSWGTRSALLYNAQFPQHVRSMILDGSAPPANTVPLYANADAERSLQALFRDCAADAICQAAFPELERNFNAVLDTLGDEGIEVSLADATSGEEITFRLTRNIFANGILAILYSPQVSRLIPIIVRQSAANDFRALSAVMDAMNGSVGISVGAQMSVLCAEDYPRISQQEIASEAEKGFVGSAFIDVFANACSVWPQAPLPEIYSQDLSSQVPTLILSGAIDPITPARWGDRMAELLTNSLHLVAPNTGHNVAPFGCAPELMAQFVSEASVANLDSSCLDALTRPSFFVNASGPTPSSADEDDADGSIAND